MVGMWLILCHLQFPGPWTQVFSFLLQQTLQPQTYMHPMVHTMHKEHLLCIIPFNSHDFLRWPHNSKLLFPFFRKDNRERLRKLKSLIPRLLSQERHNQDYDPSKMPSECVSLITQLWCSHIQASGKFLQHCLETHICPQRSLPTALPYTR